MSNEEVAIQIENLSLTYSISILSHPTFKKRVHSLIKGEKVINKVEALKNINLQVKKGEVVGVIGSNGSGKTSLMRVIGGIIPPTVGQAEVNGEVETLLALGVGFNRELSGRDNIILGGLASGMRKEKIMEKMDSIIDFAELSKFIDLPMKTYSSGMNARLAFSLALSVNPDILIIDEALSTGDAHFKEKSLGKVKSLRDENRTLVLVSHALATVEEICTRVIWLEKGEVKGDGSPSDIIRAYKEHMKVEKSKASLEDL